jgi:hypothetical protein
MSNNGASVDGTNAASRAAHDDGVKFIFHQLPAVSEGEDGDDLEASNEDNMAFYI